MAGRLAAETAHATMVTDRPADSSTPSSRIFPDTPTWFDSIRKIV